MIGVRIYHAPEWRVEEIMRYAKIRGADETYRDLIRECIAEAEAVLSYRVCFTFLPYYNAHIGDIAIQSALIDRVFSGCNNVLLFAATVGAPFDRLITKYSRMEPSKALLMQAIGAERIESLCDLFCHEMNSEFQKTGCWLTRRISPGYGDIDLSMQKDIFAILDCPRKIGVTLDESLMMSPSKSVTALAGIQPITDCQPEVGRCNTCDKADCDFRSQQR